MLKILSLKEEGFLLIILMFFTASLFSQDGGEDVLQITPEAMVGYINKANENFPERRLKKQFNINLGKYHQQNQQEWAVRLKGLKTGINLSFSDFGNQENLGYGFGLIPNLEFPILKNERLKLHSGLGVSYHTRKFHPINNPYNQAISTSFTWAYRLYLYYEFANSNSINWRIGGGYAHHSNGHTRLRNQGLNSFLVGISAEINTNSGDVNFQEEEKQPEFEDSKYSYFSLRTGLGRNVLSTLFNNRENVYVFSAEYGKVFNNTWKIGAGFYYNFYEHYYHYIKNEEFLVQPGREFERFRNSPRKYASNIGVVFSGELLLNHIGIDLDLGFDLYKPAYKLDWRINGGWMDTPAEIPDTWQLGEYSFYFQMKYRISARLGLKYYLFETHRFNPHNMFLGAYINSNLGQADFTEISLGYVYNLQRK